MLSCIAFKGNIAYSQIMKHKIMIVEDNGEITEVVSLFLEQEGFDVCSFETAEDALLRFDEEKPDLITLDINLPGMSGFDFIPAIRKKTNIPIICLTARTTDIDVVTALGNGADDYLSKPFSPVVLTAHIRACLRRSSETESEVFSFGKYDLYPKLFLLKKDGRGVPLSQLEFRLLVFLIKSGGSCKSAKEIYQEVWQDSYGDLATVGVYIQRLREKIEDDPKNPCFIITKKGFGYAFNSATLK